MKIAADTLLDSSAYVLAKYATSARATRVFRGKWPIEPSSSYSTSWLAVSSVRSCPPDGSSRATSTTTAVGRTRWCSTPANGCPAPLAALANGTAGHADEFDSVHATSDFLGTGHPAAIIVPAATAVAERQFATGRDLINAVTLGYDVGSRTISVTGGLAPMMGNHGIDSGALHSLGAAFACARLLGLDEHHHLFAAALAAQQSIAINAPYGERRHMSKAFVTGQSAFAGVTGALMAAAGFEASDNIFEAHGGIIDTWGMPGREGATDRRISALDYAVMGANFKFYSAGYPIHSPVEAVLGMKSDYGLDAEEIKSITVRMPSHPASVVNNRSMPSYLPAAHGGGGPGRRQARVRRSPFQRAAQRSACPATEIARRVDRRSRVRPRTAAGAWAPT